MIGGADQKALLLDAMVQDKVCETGAKIQRKTGASKTVAMWLSSTVRRFLSAEQEVDLINVRQIHYKKNALETMAWLPQHLSHFPEPKFVEIFEANGRADINESTSKDQEAVGKDRTDRAHSLWAQFNIKFGINGRDAMNTRMCVLYDATAVESLMKAVYDYG